MAEEQGVCVFEGPLPATAAGVSKFVSDNSHSASARIELHYGKNEYSIEFSVPNADEGDDFGTTYEWKGSFERKQEGGQNIIALAPFSSHHETDYGGGGSDVELDSDDEEERDREEGQEEEEEEEGEGEEGKEFAMSDGQGGEGEAEGAGGEGEGGAGGEGEGGKEGVKGQPQEELDATSFLPSPFQITLLSSELILFGGTQYRVLTPVFGDYVNEDEEGVVYRLSIGEDATFSYTIEKETSETIFIGDTEVSPLPPHGEAREWRLILRVEEKSLLSLGDAPEFEDLNEVWQAKLTKTKETTNAEFKGKILTLEE